MFTSSAAPGKGWPEECPPIRAANAFGFDLLANFDVTFIRRSARDGGSRRMSSSKAILTTPPSESSTAQPLTQQYAWFWEKGQKLPHVDFRQCLSRRFSNQVKVSSFLFLKTDPNELLYDDRRAEPRSRPGGR